MTNSQSPQTELAAELLAEAQVLAQCVAERMGPDYNDGFWRSCSGCYETLDGQDCGHYPHSIIFNCKLGGGCSECGGIGAIWDSTDHDAMARDSLADDTRPSPRASVERVIRDLAGKLYHHAVTKYDPDAAERCIVEAVSALAAHPKPEEG